MTFDRYARLRWPILILTLSVALMMPLSPAYAVTVTWTTTGSDSSNPGGGSLAPDVGNMKTFSSTSPLGYALKAAAFSFSASFDGGKLQKSYLAAYSGGLGVGNIIQSSTETSSPGHAVDNVGAYDMVIFAFDSDLWDPISVHINPYGSSPDTDLTYLVGGKLSDFGTEADPFSGFAGKTIAEITGLGTWFTNQNTGNGSSRTAALGPNDNTQVGRYLIIAAQLTATDRNDYFKIDSVVADPQTAPEPSTVLLLGSGLAGLGWLRRRGVTATSRA